MNPNLFNQITESFHNRQYELFVKLILEEYYDPKYTFAADQYETPVRFVQIQGLEDGLKIVKTEINAIVEGMGLLTK